MFECGEKTKPAGDSDVKVKALHAKIVELTVANDYNLELITLIDKQFLVMPFYGVRQ